MNNKLLITLVLGLSVVVAGCKDEYDHKRLGTDSPEAQKVRGMLGSLRENGEAGLPGYMERYGAYKPGEDRYEGLCYALRELVAADTVELNRMDEFGPQAYRVTLTVTTDGQSQSQAFLLVKDPNNSDIFRWAGRN